MSAPAVLAMFPNGKRCHSCSGSGADWINNARECRRCDGRGFKHCAWCPAMATVTIDDNLIGEDVCADCSLKDPETGCADYPDEPTTPLPKPDETAAELRYGKRREELETPVIVETVPLEGRGDSSAHEAFSPEHWTARLDREVSR